MKSIIAALSAAIGVLAIGTGASLALDGPGRALAASDTELQISNDPILTGDAGTTVTRSFIPPYSGTVRVKWEARSGDGTKVFSHAGVDQVSFCSRPTSSTAFVQKFCTVRVTGGMPISVTARPDDASNVASLRNVRLYYKVGNSRGDAIIYELPER